MFILICTVLEGYFWLDAMEQSAEYFGLFYELPH